MAGVSLRNCGTTADYAPRAKRNTARLSDSQVIRKSGTWSGGTFTLTFNGQTTAGIAYDATAATIKTALEGLSTIDTGEVHVVGGPISTTQLSVIFLGTLYETAYTLSINTASVTGGGTATITRCTGSTVAVYIDSNISTSSGDDVTGTAKVYVYRSHEDDRSTMYLECELTPAVAPSSATRAAIYSVVAGKNNNLYIAYVGTDDSLRVIPYIWDGSWPDDYGTPGYPSGDSWGYSPTEQIVVATGHGITNRFRSVDIDVTDTTYNNIVVSAYEAAASSGQGAYIRSYVRLTDGSTWRRAHSLSTLTTQYIKQYSEDVTVSWLGAPPAASVGKFILCGIGAHTTGDLGDYIVEYSFNVASGATDSGSLVRWHSTLWLNQAAGMRRSWFFKVNDTTWIWAGVVGYATPKFYAAKFVDGVTSWPTFSLAWYTSVVNLANFFTIDPSSNNYCPVAAEYCDDRLVFGFASFGVVYARIMREIVFKYDSEAAATASVIDSNPRPLDSNYYYSSGPIAIWGGGNSRYNSGLCQFNFTATYGVSGDVSDPAYYRKLRYVSEDTFDAPIPLLPVSSVVTSNNPVFQVRVQNSLIYPNLYGKIEIQLATDSGFTTDVRTLIQADTSYQYFGSTDGQTGITKVVTVDATDLISAVLFPGTWRWRARVVSDKGANGAWSTSRTFTVSHPPTVSPLLPAEGSTTLYGTGSVTFSWTVADTEPTDTQAEYRLEIIRNDTGASVLDTGYVVSSDEYASATVAVGLKDIPLQWRVTAKDSGGSTGSPSNWTLFTVGDAPTVAITTPTPAATLDTALPSFAWAFTGGGSRTQRAYRIFITKDSDGSLVADTLWRIGTAASYLFDVQVLENSTDYTATVQVQDSAGLYGESTVNFDTSWVAPTAPSSITVTSDDFKATVTWDNSNIDPDFVAWRVYRRYQVPALTEMDFDSTATVWVLLGEETTNEASYTYYDYLAPLGKTVEYAVVQVAERFGSLLESALSGSASTTLTGTRYFFVPEVAVGSILSFEANNVTSDTFTREVEQENIHLLGRGRQVQVGDDLGYSGSLTIQLRSPSTARSDREFLEYLSTRDSSSVYIKSPFGDVMHVSLGNIGFSRMAGVGLSDLGDLTVPYVQVIDDDQTIRVA